MSGIIAVYGLVIAVLIAGELNPPAKESYALFRYASHVSLWVSSIDWRSLLILDWRSGFLHLAAGLSVGLAGLAAGYAIGIVGDIVWPFMLSTACKGYR